MKKNNDEIRVVEWTVDDIVRISIVEDPAIQSDFMLFSEIDENDYLKLSVIDEDKHIITGPAMRPNMKIKRKDSKGEIYYGFFNEKIIEETARLFFKNGNNLNKTNLDHIKNQEVDGVYVYESWIVEDINNDKAKALGFKDIVKGDWWVTMKIDNDKIWNNFLETGKIKGFSVEVSVEEKEVKYNEEQLYNKIEKILNDDNIDDDNKFNHIKNLLK